MRTCVGCRRTAVAGELTRVSRTPEGSLVVGTGLPGRGAWLCTGSRACFDAAVRRGGLRRALRGTCEPSAFDRLEATLFDHGGS